MTEFLVGATAMGALVAGIFFLRFWRSTHDSLFLSFAVAFWLLSLNWILLAKANRDEPNTELYLLRLLAVALLIVGILNKNRVQKARSRRDDAPPAP